MFGDIPPQPKGPKSRPKSHPTQDILNPALKPGVHGHRGREPHDDYHVRLLHYNQRVTASENERFFNDNLRKGDNLRMIKFDASAHNRVIKSELAARVKIKLEEHEGAVNARREKLKELFATDEREFVKITVESCQKGVEAKLEAMKEKCRLMREQKAREDEEFVQKKRLQQYMRRCMDVIPAMTEKNLKESKAIQLQQMRENEARRESERELNKMWAQLQEKEANARTERERQQSIIRYNKDKKDRAILELQIEGKLLMKEEERRIALEDKIVLDQLAQKMRQEEMQAVEEARRKRDAIGSDLLKQIAVQKAFIAKRKEEEDALENAFAKLAQDAYDNEVTRVESSTDVLRRETAQYRQHQKQLANLRKEEQNRLDDLLRQYQCEINKNMDKAQCELHEARERLLKQTMEGRGQQIKEKRELAQRLLDVQQMENEWLTHVIDTNERLLVETARLSKMAVRDYRDDLNKQIEYNKILKERETAEMDRQLQKGKEEELKYKEMVQQLIAIGHSAGSVTHPFRRSLDKQDCHCDPPLMPK